MTMSPPKSRRISFADCESINYLISAVGWPTVYGGKILKIGVVGAVFILVLISKWKNC
jgi:hypothetical protein